MSLRNPNFKQLEKVMREVNDNSSKLIEMVKNADDESATITPFGLTQSKQKFNERVKQWLRDVSQTSGVDNETKTFFFHDCEVALTSHIVKCEVSATSQS